MLRARHLKMAARFAAYRLRAIHVFEVQAVLLNACNLRCAYCCCPEIKTRLLTTAQWVDIIQRLARVGTMRIKFQGGEPTMRNDFVELCAEVQRNGILAAVITNGLEIAKRPAILDHLDEAVFSLDSVTPEINDRLRGDGTHALVVAAIEMARQRGLPTYVNMVVTRHNLAELEAMLEFCEARGVGLNAQPVLFGTDFYDAAARPLGLTAEQIRDMHRRMAAWKRQGRGLMFGAQIYERVVKWTDYDVLATRTEGTSDCMAGRYYIHIAANGDVHPCVQHAASLTPKNIVSDGFDVAVRHVQRHDCGDCFMAYLNERKDVFGLRPAALRGIVRRG